MRNTKRNLYYITDKECERFVVGNHKYDYDKSFTGDIDYAFNTYNKEKAFEICDECNAIGMDTKVVLISVEYSLWNGRVVR